MAYPDIRDFCIALIKRTKNPIMPINVQTLADGIASVSSVMVGLTTKEQVERFQERLLKEFPDEEINRVNHDPAFIVALLSMLQRSMVNFTVESLKRNRAMERPKVDETLCFCCQNPQNTVKFQATRQGEKFPLCGNCKEVVEKKNRADNMIKSSLRQSEYNFRPIFTQLLGSNLGSVTITFEPIE